LGHPKEYEVSEEKRDLGIIMFSNAKPSRQHTDYGSSKDCE